MLFGEGERVLARRLRIENAVVPQVYYIMRALARCQWKSRFWLLIVVVAMWKGNRIYRRWVDNYATSTQTRESESVLVVAVVEVGPHWFVCVRAPVSSLFSLTDDCYFGKGVNTLSVYLRVYLIIVSDCVCCAYLCLCHTFDYTYRLSALSR